MKKKKRQDRDILWKTVLEQVFEDFLRFVFPDADKLFDLGKGFEFLDKELANMDPEPGKRSSTRLADQLVKVYRPDGGEEWVLVHVEVQGHRDPDFPKRMFQYFSRILDKYDRPVTAIAIFTGPGDRTMSDTYEFRFAGTALVYRYNTVDIQDYDDRLLLQNENPFAQVVYAAKKLLVRGKDLDKLLLEEKLLILRILHKRGLYSKPKLQAVMDFVDLLLQFQNTDTYRIFEERAKLITDKKDPMTFAEYRAQLATEEQAERIVTNMVKNTNLTDEQIASIAEVPVKLVKKIRKETTK